ncbi:MAG: lysylphosphatidylglycerol synthase transmembrane domain-containing protein [Acidimicrobiales bacterium]
MTNATDDRDAPASGGDRAEDRSRAAGRFGRWRWPRWLPPPKVLLVVVIVVAFAVLLYRIRSELATAFHRVSPAGLPWLVPAILAEVASFLCYAGVQRRLLVAGGAHLRRRTMVSLTVAATGLTNLVPGGTAPASGWLVTQYRRHDVPLPLALWAVIAGGFAASLSVLLILLCGATIAGLLGPWVFAAFLFLLASAGVAGVVASHHLPAVRRWLDRERRLPGLRLARRAAHHSGEIMQFRATVPGGAWVYVLSIGNWTLDVVVLAAAFLVVALPVPWRALLFAYAAAQVAGALAPVPGGIGFVEGGMIGAFAAAGTPAGEAVVATVIYRLITTLGMAGIGSAALFVVNRREPVRAELRGEAAALARRAEAAPPDTADPPAGGRP